MTNHRWWTIAFSIFSVLILISIGVFLGQKQIASAETTNGTIFYFPIIAKNYPAVTLDEAWTGDLNGQPKIAFYFGDPVTYVSQGLNSFKEAKVVNLNWVQKNSCGTTEIFSGNISLPPGEWTHVFTSTVPSCSGAYTNTVTLNSDNITISLQTNFDAFVPPIELKNTWTGDLNQQPKDVFFFGDPVSYIVEGINLQGQTITVDLSWTQESLCGVSEIYTTTLNIPSGFWSHVYTSTVPTCARTYTNTVQVTTGIYTTSLSTNYEGRFPSGIIINTQQAFDKCALPTVGQMQTWWNSSPYVVHNIYLGGIHYACPSDTLNASWMQAVAQQGWAFILTWVGPQAPCTSYRYKISGDPTNNYIAAYSQGIDEAAAALAKAESIGLSEEKILYYDMESYSGADSSCRTAVKRFLQGWTDWIKLQGDKAGAYGSPCYYMMDWWTNNPRPDDVWIASWLTPAQYRPDATVWNVACMNNTYWPGQQRLRQYAGGHVETYGGVSFSVDSNVLNGEITAITTTLPASAFVSEASLTAFASGQIREIDLISPEFGWVLQGNQLLTTIDGGKTWAEITPALVDLAILGVEFLDRNDGWLVARLVESNPDRGLTIFKTRDGGFTWTSSPLSLSDSGIAAAHLEFINLQDGWLSLKLQTSSNFSLGRLFATQDGGLTWEERAIPLGEPVRFVDSQRGWVAGGPAGDQLFYTADGGQTWQAQPLTRLPEGQIFVGLPEFENASTGILPVTVLASPQSSFSLYRTRDGGKTWLLDSSLPISTEPGTALAFSQANGAWWAATPGTSDLMKFPGPESGDPGLHINASGLPPGGVTLDFVSDQAGWALVQENACQGEKIPFGQVSSPGAMPFQCRMASRLFETRDGGLNWVEIYP